ncbi:hypothetical protein [Sorangium sp. So ce1335]|uniref:hypothetical protein n=1 Tax=Sorangium sp. So ce1335 TaxID=3133335 RepID=UPI003F6138C5
MDPQDAEDTSVPASQLQRLRRDVRWLKIYAVLGALALDYPNYDAMGLVTRISPDGADALAGFLINSRTPQDLDVIAAGKVVQRRIAIENHNEDARIVLSDPQGRERIRLGVDRDGQARIQMLDAEGKVTFQAPQ